MEPKSFYQKYNPELWLAAMVIAVIVIVSLLRGCLSPDVKPSVEVPTKQVVEWVKEETKPVQEEIKVKEKLQDDRDKKITSLQKQLYAAQLKNKELAAMVFTDTSEQSPCPDEYTRDLTAGAATSDSLANLTIAEQAEQIQSKDSTIALERKKYSVLEIGFGQILSNDFQKDKTIKELNRKLKWKKVEGFAVKGATAVLAAILIKNAIK